MPDVCVLTDSPVYRAGVTALLRGAHDLGSRIVEQSDIEKERINPVFILFFDEIEKYRADLIDEKVVVIINRGEKGDWFLRDHENGWGLLSYDSSADDLVAVVNAVDRGMVVLPKGELPRLIKTNFENKVLGDGDRIPETLTDRELDVLQHLGQGLQNKQIALKLGISENTIKFHVSSLFSKLGVSNRTEALRIGNKHGLISL